MLSKIRDTGTVLSLPVLVRMAKQVMWDSKAREELQKQGVSISPANFYNDIPTIEELRNGFETREAAPYLMELFDEAAQQFLCEFDVEEGEDPDGIPANEVRLGELLQHFYTSRPEGLINDRFAGAHQDFVTTEYQAGEIPDGQPWENCRGVGLSFGYNQVEDASQYMSGAQAVRHVVDAVRRDGGVALHEADGRLHGEVIGAGVPVHALLAGLAERRTDTVDEHDLSQGAGHDGAFLVRVRLGAGRARPVPLRLLSTRSPAQAHPRERRHGSRQSGWAANAATSSGTTISRCQGRAPSSASARSKSCPAGPTNGRPARSS